MAIGQRGLGESLCQAVDIAMRTGDSSLLEPLKAASAPDDGLFG